MALSRLRIEAQKERNAEEKKWREEQGLTIGEASRIRQEARKEQEAKRAAGIPTSLPTFSELRAGAADQIRETAKPITVSRNATSGRNSATVQSEIDALTERKNELMRNRGSFLNSQRWAGAERENAQDIARQVTEIDTQLYQLRKERDTLDYVADVQDNEYDDDFFGQFAANYRLGRINQDVGRAYNDYLNNDNEATRARAEALAMLQEQFQREHADVLDDDGWVRKTAAGYLPQFFDQKVAQAGGGAIGAMVGLGVGNPWQGFRVGASVATTAQSLGQMQGAAFQALMAEGFDEETAREAAKDEGFLSALIEGAGTYFSLGVNGGKMAFNAAANTALKNGSKNAAVKAIAAKLGTAGVDKIAREAAEWAGKSALQKTGSVLGGIALNAGNEYLEEAAQQAVSIANKNRENTGFFDLVKESGGVAWDAVTGKNEQARAEMHEAGTEGFKIGLMFGGTQAAVNTAVTQYANAKTNEARKTVVKTVLEDKESLEALIQEGKETGTESAKIAGEIEGKSLRNEEITEKDVERLIAANDVYIEAEVKKTAREAARNAQDGVSVAEGKDATPGKKTLESEVSKATGYGQHGTSSYIGMVQSMNADPGKVRMEFQSAYEAGRVGLSQDIARLDSNVRREAYNAGRLDAIMDLGTAKDKAKGAVIRGDAGFDRAGLPSDVTEAQYKAVDDLAKAAGVRVRIAKGLKGNAEIAEDGSVLIAEDFQREVAGKKRSIVFYAAHEIGMHRLMQLAPKEGQAFINAIIRDANAGLSYGQVTVTESKQAKYAAQDVHLTTGKAMEEVAADSIYDLYDNEEAFIAAIERVINGTDEQAKQGARKFRDILNDIVKKLKATIAKMTGKERAEAQQTLTEVESLRDLFEKGLAAATQRVKAEKAANKSGRAEETRGKIDTQYSVKEAQPNGRDRKETRAEFLRRAAGSGYSVYEGKAAAYGYRDVPGRRAQQNARQVQEEVKRLGIDAVIFEGPIRYNKDGVTSSRVFMEAVTVERSRIFINNRATVSPRNIAGHEAFHLWDNGVGRDAYVKTVEDNLRLDSRRFRGYLADIADAYLGGKVDQSDNAQVERLREEMFAFISGDIHEGIDDAGLRSMFVDYDAVKEAWNELVAKNAGAVATEGPEAGVKFSLKSPVEETKTLIALHNLTDEKLRKALALGGFPMPSIAVTRMDIPHTNFGDITLVMNKSTVDPKASRKNTVYSADAWTPTFPKVEYEVDSRVAHEFYSKARKADGSIPEEYVSKVNLMASSIDSYLNTYETEEGVVERFKGEYAIKALYLAEQGERVETKTRENRTEKAKSAMLDAVLDVFDEDVETLSRIPLSELHEKYAEDIKRALVAAGRTESAAEAMVAKKGGTFGFSKLMSKVLNYAREPEFTVETVTDNKAIEADIDSRIDEAAYERWLREMFRGLILDSGIHNGKDIYTASGNRKSFKQTHYPVTLENVAKAMAAQNGGNSKHVSGFVGIKSLRAGTAVRFKSIAHMHELEGRLKHLTQEEADAINDALGKRLSEITERIYNKKKHSEYANTFIEYDTIGNILMEVCELDKYTVDSIQKTFAQYQYNLGNQLAADIRDLLFDVTQMPVNIFEAKPERAVRFDEVLAAVLPDNADQGLCEQLEQMGLNVLTYQYGDEASRIEAVNSVEGAQFSLKEDANLMRENAKLREVNQALREQFKTTKFAKVDKKALDRFTKQLLKDYSSGAEINETRDALDGLYTYLANGEDGLTPAWNEAYKRAFEVAVSVLENATVVDDEMWVSYKDLRDRLRTVGVSISKEYSNDLYGYENLRDFRRRNAGRIKVSNDGLPVDVVYQDLANTYPELFDADEYINPADQLVHIADVLEDMRPVEINPYKHDMREAATWLANDIMERFFELPQAKPTFADKAEQKLTNQVIKDAKKLERLREQKNERIKQLIEANREKVKNAITGERMAGAREIQKLKQKYAEKDAKRSESQKASVLRAKILRHTGSLKRDLFANSDKHHVPHEMRLAVELLLDSINLESKYEYEYGKDGKYHRVETGTVLGAEPTKRTEAFRALQKVYKSMMESDAGDVTIDPNIMDILEDVIDLSDIPLSAMNTTQLNTVWRAVVVVEHACRTAGKMLSKAKYERTGEWANDMKEDTETRKNKGTSRLNGYRLDLVNPYTFFSQYGESGMAIFRMLRDAQDHQMKMTADVRSKVQEIVDSKTVRKLEKEVHLFTTERGKKLILTKSHIMDLYLLAKQEDGARHLMMGGIYQPEIKVGKRTNRTARGTEAVQLTVNDIEAITGKMTVKERETAIRLQKLTSTVLAAYGNEASMKAYGYKKFNNLDYWTIKSAKEGVHYNADNSEGNVRSIKNIGMAKSRNPHANNALNVGGIFQTFAAHTADMIDYAAWLCPMEDMNRLFNYEFRDDAGIKTGENIKGILDRVGGKGKTKGAQEYWKNLYEDIQNGIKAKSDTSMMDDVAKIWGHTKGASVAWNVRVIVQQPTAILRAAAILSPKSMIEGMFSGGGWETAVKYSPIAQRKNIGGFDIGSPMQMNSVLFDNKTGIERFNEIGSAGAAWADRVTWGRIWNACEHEVKDTRKDLHPNSGAFYEAVNELFTEVIDQSQVVDGVLQRSQIMRSSNQMATQATSFMGEPLMSLNMLLRAWDAFSNETDKGKRGKAIKVFGRTATALLITNVVNALAQSLVDAARDDEDEEYWEKFMTAFIGITGDEKDFKAAAKNVVLEGNLVGGINPVGYIPVVKDLLSIMSGYSVQRADAAIMEDLYQAGKNAIDSLAGDGKKTNANALLNLGKQVGKVFGVGAGNLTRDVYAALRTVAIETGNIPFQYELEKWIYKNSNEKNDGRFVDILYKAYMTDKDVYRHIYDDLVAAGVSAGSIKKKMEDRTKKAQGVNSVDDLAQRYLAPDQQTVYDKKLKAMKGSDLWSGASAKQRDKVEDKLYGIVTGSDKESLEKLSAGSAFGLDDTEYLLYSLALDMVDQPNDNGKLGSYNNAEKAAALLDLDLGDSEMAFLWNTDQGYEAFADGVDMGHFVEFKAGVAALEGTEEWKDSDTASRKRAIKMLLRDMGLSAGDSDYKWLYGTKYKK